MPGSLICTEPPCTSLSSCFPCNRWGNVSQSKLGFIVPIENHIVLFFLFFAFNIFDLFYFLFGRHGPRVGSVEKTARNHLCATLVTLFMSIHGNCITSDTIGGEIFLTAEDPKQTHEKKSFSREVWWWWGRIKYYENHALFKPSFSVFSSQGKKYMPTRQHHVDCCLHHTNKHKTQTH